MTSQQAPLFSTSRQFVHVQVPQPTINGTAYDPTGDTVYMCFLSTSRAPQPGPVGTGGDFYPASWETQGETFFVNCLIGPGSGNLTLTPGTWYVSINIIDNPEQPIIPCGVIVIT